MSSKIYRFTSKKKTSPNTTTTTTPNHPIKSNITSSAYQLLPKDKIDFNSNNISLQKPLPKIRVCVRKRPANKKECLNGDIDIIEIKNSNSLTIKELK